MQSFSRRYISRCVSSYRSATTRRHITSASAPNNNKQNLAPTSAFSAHSISPPSSHKSFQTRIIQQTHIKSVAPFAIIATSGIVAGLLATDVVERQQPAFPHLQDSFWHKLFPTAQALMPSVVSHDNAQKQMTLPKPKLWLLNEIELDHGGLVPNEFRPFRCCDINVISEDTCIYFFNLQTRNHMLNPPPISYVLARAEFNDDTVIRPYCPIANFRGEMPILVKTYPNGKMGNVFAALKVSDTMWFRGPFQVFDYQPNSFDTITLICAGTGITPMMQLIDNILTNPIDRTVIHLIYANKSQKDILMVPELQQLADVYTRRFMLTLLIDEPERNWEGLVGHIDKELINSAVGPPSAYSKVFVCGPPPMVDAICGPKASDYSQGPIKGYLGELGYSNDEVFKL